ncbi:hypothetical protein EV201_0960 [Ancylomarina subtilis]|uniref:Uncharacterized protein n=1 Tax=Ancylomarina subtilis TaxID=1639035 RepID=A0A4Q7VJI5_9BACT|nr:hypothetical protein EV201_0960 [Ancylomarina subtilis]
MNHFPYLGKVPAGDRVNFSKEEIQPLADKFNFLYSLHPSPFGISPAKGER